MDVSCDKPVSLAFTRQQRLLSPAQYKLVLSEGVRISGKYFRLCGISRAEGAAVPRLGLAIAKRSVRRSVDRNRVKRLARESFRYQQHCMPSVDVVVFANPSVVGADLADMRRHLDRQWQQLCRKLAVS